MVKEPIDKKLPDKAFANDVLPQSVQERLLREEKKARKEYWHFAVPCESFSIMNATLNHGTRSRERPWGDGSLGREEVGNKIIRFVLKLVRVLEYGGNSWSIENPHSSYLFRLPPVRRIIERTSTTSVVLDQCMYGLAFPDRKKDERCKKQTRIISNLALLSSLARKCDLRHRHVHAFDGVKIDGHWVKRSALAARYPSRLCDAWSKAVCGKWCSFSCLF